MPTFNMGETLNIDKGGLFVKLKSKGDKVKFRLVKGGYYDGKHFIKTVTGWDVTPCPRIMDEGHCDLCDKFFKISGQAKLLKDENEKKSVMKEADVYRVKMTFFYPIIDREEGKAKILKTTMSVRQELEQEFKDGVNVYDYDYILTRTEESPAKYYKLTRMPDKQCTDLTKDELAEQKKLESMDLEKLCGDVKQSTQDFGKENVPDKEVEDIVIPDDMPF